MRFYVHCKQHPQERIYLRFAGREPQQRIEVPLHFFRAQCNITNEFNHYTTGDVFAEEGAQLPLTGAGLGALLFFINPISGIIGTIIGLFGGQSTEEDRVRRFNSSPIP
jgi:hypothetical protein